jgi:hypothetical protein
MENLLNSLGMPCSSFFERWRTVSPRAALFKGYVQGEGKGSTNPIKVSRENFPTNPKRTCRFPGNARGPVAWNSRQISENKPNRKRFLEGFEGLDVGDIAE